MMEPYGGGSSSNQLLYIDSHSYGMRKMIIQKYGPNLS